MKRIHIEQLISNPALIAEFISDLKSGKVAAIPTDTLYGLAAEASSKQGIQAIYNLKGRDKHKPLILFLPGVEKLSDLEIQPDTRQAKLLSTFWPGALTAIFKTPTCLSSKFDFPTIGIRVPAHAQLRALLNIYPGYLLTTSCNRSGQPPLQDADAISQEFGESLCWILDGGKSNSSLASTVLNLTTTPPTILREGALSKETLAITGIFDIP